VRLSLTYQPLLLANNAPGLLQLLGHSYTHPIDDIQDALFVDQQPAAEKDSPPFRQRIFQFVNQLI
jgi:hypothetical protein